MNNKTTSINRKWYFSLLLPLFLSSCGGGGGSSVGAPTVSSTSPADNASNVARNSTITATFNQDILNTSIDAGSFRLKRMDDGFLLGNIVSFDGETNVASLTPPNSLDILTTYEVTLSNDIIDLSGNALQSDYNWSFTTADGAWGDVMQIESDPGEVRSLNMAANDYGDAFVVWSKDNTSGNNSIWTSRFNGTSWSSSIEINTSFNGSSHALNPQITVDDSGNALAVWQQSDTGSTNIWANHFNGTSWLGAEVIQLDAGFASTPQIVFDNIGNALAVWEQFDGSVVNIWANYFDGTSWGAAEKIETNDAGDASAPQIAFDNRRRARAVWTQNNGSVVNIWTNRFDGTNWDSAVRIETDDAGDASDPQIAFDGNDNALIVWVKGDGMRDNLWAARINNSGSFGVAKLLETENLGNAFQPQIAFDNNGNALAVWGQNGGLTATLSIWANRFDGTSWGTAEKIETDDVEGGIRPQIVIDNNGNALAVWQHFGDAYYEIWANRFDGTSWGNATVMQINNIAGSYSPQVAVDSNGNGLAVWKQSDGSDSNITVSRFE